MVRAERAPDEDGDVTESTRERVTQRVWISDGRREVGKLQFCSGPYRQLRDNHLSACFVTMERWWTTRVAVEGGRKTRWEGWVVYFHFGETTSTAGYSGRAPSVKNGHPPVKVAGDKAVYMFFSYLLNNCNSLYLVLCSRYYQVSCAYRRCLAAASVCFGP